MDFYDDDSIRPKLLAQPRSSPSPQRHQQSQPLKSPLTILTLAISSLFLILTFLFIHSEPLKSILIWLSLSLLLGPLAPPSLTAGSILVGQGPVVSFPHPQEPDHAEPETVRRRKNKGRRNDGEGLSVGNFDGVRGGSSQMSEDNVCVVECEEIEWSEGDVEVLKRQLVKHPVGTLRRWEVIAEAFNGRHKVESVIRKSKELGARKSMGGEGDDSYASFLKDRKPLDQRVELLDKKDASESSGNGAGEVSWSGADDIALLNAVKTFPKDVSMRWEKVAAAVPGKTKAACVKRFAELKKDFRNSKKAGAND